MIIYILSKILPPLFQPLGICLILIILFLKLKKKWLIYLAFLILWSFSSFFTSQFLLRIVESQWKQIGVDSVDKASAIVVLSGGLQPNSNETVEQEWQDPDRFFAGLKLFKHDKAANIIFTAGIRPLQPKLIPESEIYYSKAIDFGIPKENIMVTKFAKNTAEEALRVKELLKTKDEVMNLRIILVTSAFHMNRAKALFERNNIEVIPFPVDFKTYDYERNNINSFLFKITPTAHNLSNSSLAIREIMGRIFYWIF